MSKYSDIDSKVRERIKQNIEKFIDREKSLGYDEHYCIYCTSEKIDIPKQTKIREFTENLVNETELQDDIDAIMRTPGHDINENESYFKRNRSGYPSGKVKYGLYISYIFD